MEISIIDAEERLHTVSGKVGETLMRIATRNGVKGIDAECGGSCACATCHVVFSPEEFARVGEPGPNEAGLLDMLAESGPTSRLACQIKLSAEHDGLCARVPRRT